MSNTEDIRPSPEAMLKLARAEEAEEEQGRGKLRIFLGYAAGVGKTYAMLEAAELRKMDGRDVVAGYIESHGRFETDSLLALAGIEIVPRMEIRYQGVQLAEMDLDAVLSRKPQIALVDELAHTNAPGCRHEKRWQDVEELLAAGIDVYTTVNVQHFESLNDIVARITGIKVRETVPDRLLDEAAEIRLVDISPEDLLQRLKEGKVYIPEQAARAMETFFRPGNLIALRELSLRRAASRVDDQMRAYMETRSITGPWPAAERLMVAVSGSPYSEQLIRATRRLADELKAPWHTIYVETPSDSRQARENRERVWRDMRLAESLGSEVMTVTAVTVADAVVNYAIRHNVTKIVVGKPMRPRWRELLRAPVVDQIIRGSGIIDVMVVSFEGDENRRETELKPRRKPQTPHGYAASLALVGGATLLCQLVHTFLNPINMVMVYLLAVVLASVRLGLRPAVATAFLGVLAFDFFFVPPHFTLRVMDSEYIVTFVALFVVGVVISTLVTKSRQRADIVRDREAQTASLYYLTRDLAASADVEGVLHSVVRNFGGSLNARVAIFLPEGERLEMSAVSQGLKLDINEHAVADWAFRNNQPAGRGTDTLVSSELLYQPLRSSANVLGVMGISLEEPEEYTSQEIRRLLDAFATQIAMALERVHLAHQAEQAQVLRARENLERALLNSISHDLRTPLVTITGVLGSVLDEEDHLTPQSRRNLLETAREEAARLNRFVGNLLDMTRLEAGAMTLRREPCDVQDLIGCALAAIEPRLGRRRVEVQLAPELPLVQLDMVLMIQVIVNLLDNALKHSPPEGVIGISASADGAKLSLSVSDEGQGAPEQDLKRIFDKFYRIPVPEGVSGTGLGLSICKGIVEAHGGSIRAENLSGGGFRVTFKIPLT